VKVLFTPSARVQFVGVIERIWRSDRAAARRFRKQAESGLARLARFPRSGAVVVEFPELPYREFYVKPYRFFYRIQEDTDTVWIVGLWHGAQIPDEPETP
jgi:plasmid stabilization system protein ParE